MSMIEPLLIEGGAYEVGYALGRIARPLIDDYMSKSAAWQRVKLWRGSGYARELWKITAAAHPDSAAELQGMAAGMRWATEDVFLWNCRGELIHNAPGGCTTLAAHTPLERFIAHNEDGDPNLRGKCALVDVRPAGKPGFVSFYYPGSLPGHTFAVNRAGLVQTINNIRIKHPSRGVPRMVLSRPVLDTLSLDAAAALLSGADRASGFHHTIGCVGDGRLLSIEASAARCSVVDIVRLCGHANHLIHEGSDNEAQIVTASSHDRQARLEQLLPAIDNVSSDALLQVLFDKQSEALPIYRDDPADQDDENTLATALFVIKEGGVEFEVRQGRDLQFKTFIVQETSPRATS